MSAIFISHSSRDNEQAALVAEQLREHGHRGVFLDFDPADGIPAGRDWERELYLRVRECRVVVVLCSTNSMASKWCFMEITHARALGKPLFPIHLDDCALEGVLTDRQVLSWDDAHVWQKLFRGLAVAGLDAADPFDWDQSRPPYPGLLAFQEADAAIFFGRDGAIGDGLDLLGRVARLGSNRLAMVLGASGSGKSSLVRAGLLPRLRRDPDRWWIVGPLRPQNDPFHQLALALAALLHAQGRPRPVQSIEQALRAWTPEPQTAADQDVSELERAADALLTLARDAERPDVVGQVRRLRRSLSPRALDVTGRTPLEALAEELRVARDLPQARLLVVVDQFEELLGVGTAQDSAGFLQMLRAASQSLAGKVVVLGTMRSDYLGALQQHPALRELEFHSLSLGPMGPDAIAQTIEGPADLAGIDLEAGLVQRIACDAEGSDALPLMAFALRELYDRHASDGRLTLSEYQDQLGGLTGAIARAADDVLDLDTLPKTEREALRKGFLGLVRVDERGRFARRVALWSALPAHGLLERYVTARLLVSGADDAGRRTLEVAHEALFRSWPALVEWLSQSRAVLRMKADVERAAESWFAAGHPDDRLWHGGRLARVQEYMVAGELELPVGAAKFVARSLEKRRRDEARRSRRQRTTLIASLAAAVVMASLGAFGLNQAKQAQAVADRSASSLLALRNLRAGDPRLAIQGAAALEEALGNEHSARLLYQTVASTGNTKVVLADQSEDLRVIQVQDGWAHFTTESDGTERHVWINEHGERRTEPPSHGPESVVLCEEGELRIRASGRVMTEVHSCQAWTLSPSSDRVAAVVEEEVRVVDLNGVQRDAWSVPGAGHVEWGDQGIMVQARGAVLHLGTEGPSTVAAPIAWLCGLDAAGNAVVSTLVSDCDGGGQVALDAQGRPTPRVLGRNVGTHEALAWDPAGVTTLHPLGPFALVQAEGAWVVPAAPSPEFRELDRPADSLGPFGVTCEVTGHGVTVVDTGGDSVAILPQAAVTFGGHYHPQCSLGHDESNVLLQVFRIQPQGSVALSSWSLPGDIEGLLTRARELAGDPDPCLLVGSLRPDTCDD